MLAAAMLGLFFRILTVFMLYQIAKRTTGKPWHFDFESWCLWDCMHYSNLSGAYVPDFSTFFPLWPGAIALFKACSFVLSGNAATILLSNISGIVATVLLVKLVLICNERYSTGYSPWLLAVAVNIFPYNHFWSHGYSESFFLTLFLLALVFLAKKQYIRTTFIIALLTITRPQGLWLAFFFLGFLLWQAYRSKVESISFAQIVLTSLILALPFSGFLVWQYYTTGDALYFWHLQKIFDRGFSFTGMLKAHFFLTDQNRLNFQFNHILLYFSWFSGIYLLRKKIPVLQYLGVITIVLAELPLMVGGSAGAFFSYNRFMAVNLGIFFVFSSWLQGQKEFGYAILIIATARLFAEIHKWHLGIFTG